MMQRNDFAANGLHFAAKRLVSPTVTGMFYPNTKRFNQKSVGTGWTNQSFCYSFDSQDRLSLLVLIGSVIEESIFSGCHWT